jgi:hypothetical protein
LYNLDIATLPSRILDIMTSEIYKEVDSTKMKVVVTTASPMRPRRSDNAKLHAILRMGPKQPYTSINSMRSLDKKQPLEIIVLGMNLEKWRWRVITDLWSKLIPPTIFRTLVS